MYNELGYIPWHNPRRVRKERGKGGSVYIGTREAIPFLNQDAKRTLSHLILRPGYMMRDYIFRGQHERYLAPFTALLVFYSVFTLIVAVVKPSTRDDSVDESLLNGFRSGALADVEINGEREKTTNVLKVIVKTATDAILLTRLDLHPEAADTHWKESLAAIEGDLRSKGIPLFLGNFLIMWLAMAIVLRKYKLSFSGAAAASAYVLCQFCIFMFLALLLTTSHESTLGPGVMGILLLIDYHQMLHIKLKPAFWLTVKTGLFYLLFLILFYVILGTGLILFALAKV